MIKAVINNPITGEVNDIAARYTKEIIHICTPTSTESVRVRVDGAIAEATATLQEENTRLRQALATNAAQEGPIVRKMNFEGMSDDKGELSDGYHTFNELYDHRHALFIALARCNPLECWRSKEHEERGTMPPQFFIVGMELPTGSITYHLPLTLWDKTNFIPTVGCAPPWDGHTSADVVERLHAFAQEGPIVRGKVFCCDCEFYAPAYASPAGWSLGEHCTKKLTQNPVTGEWLVQIPKYLNKKGGCVHYEKKFATSPQAGFGRRIFRVLFKGGTK